MNGRIHVRRGERNRQFIRIVISLFRQRDLFRIQIMKNTFFTYKAKSFTFMFYVYHNLRQLTSLSALPCFIVCMTFGFKVLSIQLIVLSEFFLWLKNLEASWMRAFMWNWSIERERWHHLILMYSSGVSIQAIPSITCWKPIQNSQLF